jgi:hypothetical protein
MENLNGHEAGDGGYNQGDTRTRSIWNLPGFIRHEFLKPFLENSLGIRWELVQLFFEGFFKTGEQSVS